MDIKELQVELVEQRKLVSQCFGSIAGKIDKAREESKKRSEITFLLQIAILIIQLLIALLLL